MSKTDTNEVTKLVRYYRDNIYEDGDEIITIGDSAAATLYKRFGINVEDPIVTTAIFLKITESFIKKLVSLEKSYNEFAINLAGRLEIGFTNNDNEEDEKSGNFMIYFRHLRDGHEKDGYDPTISPQERAVQWNAENVIVQPEIIRSMCIEAIDALKEIDIELRNSEIVMPCFVVYYESIITYIKIRRREEDVFEKNLNFAWFTVCCREDADGKDKIFIRPTIGAKLAVKNDENASSDI